MNRILHFNLRRIGVQTGLLCGMLIIAAAYPVRAGVLRLARPFNSNAVLQRGQACPVFGADVPGSRILVTFGSQQHCTVAAADGHWRINLSPLAANSHPQNLTVRGSAELVLTNLVVGDVWLISGQSNADWPLRDAKGGGAYIASATNAQIRYLHLAESLQTTPAAWTTAQVARLTPEDYFIGTWQVNDPASAGTVSAIGYLFARQIGTNQNVPLGLIDCTVGGTPIESWIPTETLRSNPRFAPLLTNFLNSPRIAAFVKQRTLQNLDLWNQAGRPAPMPEHPYAPGACWRFGLAELAPFAIRGVLWYQGESNADFYDPAEFESMAAWYTEAFTLLTAGWRASWEQSELPIYTVQLPLLNRPAWPWFRECQSLCAATLTNVALAVAYDVGATNNVHPVDKQPVADRLARIARARSYGEPIEWSGPVLRRWKVRDQTIVLEFDHLGGGLAAADGKPLRHFEMAGADRKFFPATACISGDQIIVSTPMISAPVAVRYAWSPTGNINFFSLAGLPVSPFRTDDWPAKGS